MYEDTPPAQLDDPAPDLGRGAGAGTAGAAGRPLGAAPSADQLYPERGGFRRRPAADPGDRDGHGHRHRHRRPGRHGHLRGDGRRQRRRRKRRGGGGVFVERPGADPRPVRLFHRLHLQRCDRRGGGRHRDRRDREGDCLRAGAERRRHPAGGAARCAEHRLRPEAAAGPDPRRRAFLGAGAAHGQQPDGLCPGPVPDGERRDGAGGVRLAGGAAGEGPAALCPGGPAGPGAEPGLPLAARPKTAGGAGGACGADRAGLPAGLQRFCRPRAGHPLPLQPDLEHRPGAGRRAVPGAAVHRGTQRLRLRQPAVLRGAAALPAGAAGAGRVPAVPGPQRAADPAGGADGGHRVVQFPADVRPPAAGLCGHRPVRHGQLPVQRHLLAARHRRGDRPVFSAAAGLRVLGAVCRRRPAPFPRTGLAAADAGLYRADPEPHDQHRDHGPGGGGAGAAVLAAGLPAAEPADPGQGGGADGAAQPLVPAALPDHPVRRGLAGHRDPEPGPERLAGLLRVSVPPVGRRSVHQCAEDRRRAGAGGAGLPGGSGALPGGGAPGPADRHPGRRAGGAGGLPGGLDGLGRPVQPAGRPGGGRAVQRPVPLPLPDGGEPVLCRHGRRRGAGAAGGRPPAGRGAGGLLPAGPGRLAGLDGGRAVRLRLLRPQPHGRRAGADLGQGQLQPGIPARPI